MSLKCILGFPPHMRGRGRGGFGPPPNGFGPPGGGPRGPPPHWGGPPGGPPGEFGPPMGGTIISVITSVVSTPISV